MRVASTASGVVAVGSGTSGATGGALSVRGGAGSAKSSGAVVVATADAGHGTRGS